MREVVKHDAGPFWPRLCPFVFIVFSLGAALTQVVEGSLLSLVETIYRKGPLVNPNDLSVFGPRTPTEAKVLSYRADV